MKKSKIHSSCFMPHKFPPAASVFPVHIPPGIPPQNFFPKLSIYVVHKFNTV